MISINGVTLSNDLLIQGEFDYPEISQSIRHTFGSTIIQEKPIAPSRTFIISTISDGSNFSGYFTRTQVLGFKAIASAGTIVSFIYESDTYNVKFVTGEMKVVPLIPRPNQDGADYYTGSITLIEV